MRTLGNVLAEHPPSPVQDLHFRIEGPVVSQLQDAFANDWAFTTGDVLDGQAWFPKLKGDGAVIARVITDGPDGDFEKARWTLLAALVCHGQSDVLPEDSCLTTPLPGRELADWHTR